MPAKIYNQSMEHPLTFRAPDEMKVKLHRIAEKETTRVSELIRTWLEIFIEDYEMQELSLKHMPAKAYDKGEFS